MIIIKENVFYFTYITLDYIIIYTYFPRNLRYIYLKMKMSMPTGDNC